MVKWRLISAYQRVLLQPVEKKKKIQELNFTNLMNEINSVEVYAYTFINTCPVIKILTSAVLVPGFVIPDSLSTFLQIGNRDIYFRPMCEASIGIETDLLV